MTNESTVNIHPSPEQLPPWLLRRTTSGELASRPPLFPETLRGVTDPPLVCSAKGCREPATWALRWNNPKLHPPERRKTWLACDDHRESLAGFLSARGFLRETEPAGSAPSDS